VLKSLFSALSPAGRRARLSILILHRVLAAPDPLFPNEIDARRFDAICDWLRSWFNVLPLDAAVRGLRAESLPERALSITFDDGYADNRTVALPILQRHRLSATIFVATGYLDGGCMWNDILVEAVRRSPQSRLPLQELGLPALVSMPIESPAQKRAVIDALIRSSMYLPHDQRTALAKRLAELAGVEPSTDLMMSSTQVVELHRAGMQIGAHTVSHPILAQLDAIAVRAEVVESKRRLEGLIGERVGLFAYPNGRPETDFSAATLGVVRAAGFDAAMSTAWGCADARTDLFQLPRFTPWDRSRLRFGARLAGNLMASRRRPPRMVEHSAGSGDGLRAH